MGRLSLLAENSITVKLTEDQRVMARAIKHSGGDGSALKLDIDAGAAHDIAQRKSDSVNDLLVAETADTVTPFAKSVTLDFNDGTLVITASETIDVGPKPIFY